MPWSVFRTRGTPPAGQESRRSPKFAHGYRWREEQGNGKRDMTRPNRLRCPHCGACFEVDAFAKDTEQIACHVCGETVKLVEEDPDGILSGALPPTGRLAALGAAVLLTLLALLSPFFAILALCAVAYLAYEVFQGHARERKERIAGWDRQRNAYVALSARIAETQAELQKTRTALDELSAKYGLIDPDKRAALAADVAAQKHALGVLGEIAQLADEKGRLKSAITELKSRIISFEEEEMLQSFGFYKPLYDCADSQAYRQLLDNVRDRQKQMVKAGEALRSTGVFVIEGDKATSKKIVKNLEKLILRAFNGECDATIDNVTFSNADSIRARITKSFNDLNELGGLVWITITQAYLNSKLEELQVCYEYQAKLKEEKEEQRKIRERMREEARVIKEIEEAKAKIEKEERHFNQVIDELKKRMESAAATEREQYEKKLKEYQDQLAAVEKDKAEVQYREQSTRAGYVYIISNIGSFGEHVYKIGVTRRLEPLERIDELGDASVPFDFDVHALIFSDDAPGLESALHDHFAHKAVNRVNPRKEFFKVDLSEIEDVVRTHHNSVVEFTRIAKAEDFRLSHAEEHRMIQDVAT